MTNPAEAFTPGPAGADAYRHFLDAADRLVRPLIALMEEGQSSLPIAGRESNHGDAADRLEAFARPLLLLSLWLRGRRVLGLADDTDAFVIRWAHEAMKRGSTRSDPAYWGTLTNYHQHAVEFAIFTMALDVAREELWDGLDDGTRDSVLRFIAQIRGHGGHRNNHLFFDVFALEFLMANGAAEPGDDVAVSHHLDELECMHRKEGWFIDGANETYDHYNAYAFHVYGLWWAHKQGRRDPERAERWIKLATEFLPSYADLYASTGEPVPLGRSLTYRFNGVGVFPMAAANGIDVVPYGAARRICRACIDFFSRFPVEQSQGCLSLGWINPFERLAENYSCAGSPYWAAKGLLMLALDPTHAFFTEAERPMPSESDGERHVKAPGWAIVRRKGDSMVVNAGGGSSMSILQRFGPFKWGKLVYRTSVAGLMAAGPEGDPCDCGLVAKLEGTERFVGRHNPIPIAVESDRIVCQYQLGIPYEEMNASVRTHLWWRGDWFIALHLGVSYQPTVFRAGAFALADPTSASQEREIATAANDRWRTETKALLGFNVTGVSEATGRQHLYSDKHALPYVESGVVDGRFALAHAWSLGPTGVPSVLEADRIAGGTLEIRIDGSPIALTAEPWDA